MKKIMNAYLAQQLAAAHDRHDGYLMGATGQHMDTLKYGEGNWLIEQYFGAQHEKALYWFKNAQRCWIATEYSSTIPNFPGIETRINSNYGAWLAQAKEEARKEEERVAQKLPSEERFKQIEAAIMELAEIATGGEA